MQTATALSAALAGSSPLTLTLMTVMEPAIEHMPTYTKMLVVPWAGATQKIRNSVIVRAAAAYSTKPAAAPASQPARCAAGGMLRQADRADTQSLASTQPAPHTHTACHAVSPDMQMMG